MVYLGSYINNTPRIPSATEFFATLLNDAIGSDGCEREVDFVLTSGSGKIIDFDFGLDQLVHDLAFELPKFIRDHGVSFGNHRNNVDLKLVFCPVSQVFCTLTI